MPDPGNCRHLAGMREDGDPIPPPTVQVNYVEVAV